MKKLLLFISIIIAANFSFAQEKHGNTLNIGLGLGYYGYLGGSVPALNINYEFDVANNFTIAPFISFWSYYYTESYKGNKYRYRSTIVPVGAKGSFYLDDLVNLDSKFDIYLGLSLGFNLGYGRWDDGYEGPKYSRTYNPLYLDLHAGAEYHFNDKLGIYLDLSSGFSSLGLAIHM